MSMTPIIVTGVKPLGQSGKLGLISFTAGEKPGSAKAWLGDFQFNEGASLSVEFEQKDNEYNGTTTKEIWIKSPPKNGGGGFKGGGGKSDPEKLAIERDKLALEKEKQGNINRICDEKAIDIISQVIFKAAIETAIHETKPGTAVSPDAVDVNAQNYVQIFHKIRAGVGGGNQT